MTLALARIHQCDIKIVFFWWPEAKSAKRHSSYPAPCLVPISEKGGQHAIPAASDASYNRTH